MPARSREASGSRVEVSRAQSDEPVRCQQFVGLRQLAGRVEGMLDVVPHCHDLESAALFQRGDTADPERHTELASSPLDDVWRNVDSSRGPARADRFVDEESGSRADVEQPSRRGCELPD